MVFHVLHVGVIGQTMNALTVIVTVIRNGTVTNAGVTVDDNIAATTASVFEMNESLNENENASVNENAIGLENGSAIEWANKIEICSLLDFQLDYYL